MRDYSIRFSATILLCSLLLDGCVSNKVQDTSVVDDMLGPVSTAVTQALEKVCAIDGHPIGSRCAGEPPVNAHRSVIEINPDVLSIAAALDSLERPMGALHGQPILLKANIETGDRMATTAGAHAMQGFRAESDATLVERLRASGAVVFGKANLSEWANFRSNDSVSGWSGLGGQTGHALDAAYNPCGSSSGSAVAVALGLVPLSIGTETDGSIICPASINGIVGIKPTLGLVSRAGIIPLAHSQDTAGPMAKTVTEAALLLSVIAGHDVDDIATKAIPDSALPLDYVLDPAALKGKRIGVLRSFYGSGEYADIERVFDRTLATLRNAGAVLVDPISIETEGMGDAEYTVLLSEFKADLNSYLASRDAPVVSLADVIAYNEAHAEQTMPYFGQDILQLAEATTGLDATAYKEALKLSKQIAITGLLGAFETHGLDALVVPSNGPSWKTDYVDGDGFSVGSSSLAAISGFPSVTVPAGQANGFPLGVSFIGQAWQDGALIELAFAFEQASRARD